MITSSWQDENATNVALAIKDYFSRVHSGGHPLNLKRAVCIFGPFWHNSEPGKHWAHTLLWSCQWSRWLYFLSVGTPATVWASRVVAFYTSQWWLHTSHRVQRLSQGGCGSGDRPRRLVVRSPAAAVCILMRPWAKCWVPNCQWQLFQQCMTDVR